MRQKIYMLVGTYFQQRDYRRFGVDILIANGFDVEVWEVFRLWNKIYAETYAPPDPAKFSGLRHFTRIADIRRELGKVRQSDTVLVLMSETWQRSPIFRILAARRLYFGSLAQGIVQPVSSLIKYRRFLKSPRSLWGRIYVQLPHWIRRTQPSRFLLLCGGQQLESAVRQALRADLIWTHALDYDLAVEARKAGGGENPRHVVFLDEYAPFHPDYLVLGIPAPCTAEEYYPKLTTLFAEIERQSGLPVVIAAHPRAKYREHPDFFQGRQIIQGQTCSLVRDAALVVTHASTSNNFTVIYRKPALVVTTDGLKQCYLGPHIEATARDLKASFVNLDEPWELNPASLYQVNEMAYAEYFMQIIKRSGTAEENTWQIFADHLKQRFKVTGASNNDQ